MKLRIGEAVFEVEPASDGAIVRSAGSETRFRCVHLGNGLVRVEGPAGALDVWVSGARAGALGETATVTRELSRGGGAASGSLTPPMPATVSRIFVAEGERVVAGQPLLVLVAMKTEITLRSPHAGLVSDLRAAIGQNVRPGDRLVHVEREGTG